MSARNAGLSLLVALVCGAGLSAPASAASSSASYSDLSDRLVDAEFEAWYGAMGRLREGFDQICGDTFCEGDYSNIQPLRMRCSADARGRVGQCVWTFAASNEEIDAATGRIAVQPKVWRCRLPLAPMTSVSALVGALDVPEPLYATLPGTGRTLYDGLIDCL